MLHARCGIANSGLRSTTMSSDYTSDPNRLVDTRDAADMLGRHPAVLADWRHQGRGPKYIRDGRSIRYRIGDLIDYIDENTITPEIGRAHV